MAREKIDRQVTLEFMKKYLPDEGPITSDLLERWSNNDFTEEEIDWFQTYFEKHGMPECTEYGYFC